ncbi:MAG: hypothetical protein KBE65_13310 [Phycisphaerae bacterium]|nr:hypothetical protein [Phycisphaerae bacterium]
MEILEVDSEEYRAVIHRPYHVFNSAEFNLLNRHKCDDVLFFLFRDEKYRLGLVCGLKDGMLLSPFSAPFGGLSYLRSDIGIPYIERAIEELQKSCSRGRVNGIKVTLPPLIYDTSFISKMINALFRQGFTIASVDVNHALDLHAMDNQGYTDVARDARRIVRTAFGRGVTVRRCNVFDDLRTAYQIVEHNKLERGYPIRMTWEQVKETVSLVPADVFLVADSHSQDIAAAIVFRVQEGKIAQVVLWGDTREYAEKGTMNCLALEICKYYRYEGFRYVDVGPSTENSVPNYGLCQFKEGIGCTAFPKLSMVWKT